MSDVERRLEAWKESISGEGSLTASDVLELEAHLRDSVESLSRVGLSNEEAMLVALRRIGDPAVLAVEYRKVNPGLAWARRWYWMAAGFLTFSFALAAIRLVSHAGAWLTLGTGSPAVWFVLVALAGLAGLCAGMLHSARSPGGWLARTLQRVASRIERHPLVAAHAAFAALAGLTILDRFASGYAWRLIGVDALSAISLFEALAATAAPVGLFLLARHINRGPNREEPAG